MTKIRFRITSVFLCIIILLQTLPLAVFAAELQKEAASAAELIESTPETKTETKKEESFEADPEPTVLEEVEEKREPNKKTFRMSDGTFQEAVYPYDVHYEGEDGKLLDIDNRLSDGADDTLQNASNAATVRFFKKSSSGEFYSLENDKNKVTVSIEGAEKVSAVFENTPTESSNRMALTNLTGRVLYEEIFHGVDLEYTLISKRIKENVIIKEKGALSSLTYTYAFNGSVKAVQENDREIIIYNKKGEEVLFTITAPALWDAKGNYSENLTLAIVEAKNNKITVRLDFTIDEEMVYPVTVDPVLRFQAERNDIQDTHIISAYPTTNYNTNNHIRIRNNGYALLQFPTPTLRPGDKIIHAQFALFPYGYFDASSPSYSNANSYNPTLKLTAHRINQAWNEKTVTYQSADPENGFYSTIAEAYHVVGSNTEFYSWDITRLATEWTEGSVTNHGILLKYAANPSDGSMFDTFFCSTNGVFLQQVVWPQIVYSYINTIGVEEYFSYHTQSLGFSGEGYVNDMTGNLTVTRELVTTGGNIAPISLSLIYNTASATTTSSAPYGTGWKLNLAQKCVQITPPGSEETYVQYTDADGTLHYFKMDEATGIWTDEIDPDRKIYFNSANNDYEMKDSSGTTLYFTKNGSLNEWYLYKIEDIYGNKIQLSLDPSNLNRVNSVWNSSGSTVYLDYSIYGYLTAVRYMDEGVEKTVSIQYNNRMTVHNNGVSDLVFPDGSAARYNYWSGTNLLSAALNLDNSFIQYNYHFTSGRVAAVMEVSPAGAVGNSYTFAYEPTATTIVDVGLGRTYLYTFSANGTLKSVVDTTENDGNGYGQYYEYNGGNTSLTGMGNLTFASKTQKNTVNLLPNHSFEQDGYIAGVAYGADSASASFGFTTEKARLGNRSYKLTAPASGNYTEIFGYYYLSVPAAEQYTLSAYINTAGMTSSGGARVVAIVGSKHYYSEAITEAKDEWQRLSVTFLVAEAQSISFCVSLSGATGSIYFDNMQLEVGGLSDYNLLENAGFETDSAWNFYGNTYYTAENKISGTRSGKIEGFPDFDYHFYQTISVPNGKKGDTYVASAFAKATSVPAEDWKFTLLVRFIKNGATVFDQNIYFNSHTTGWQKVSGAAKATEDYDGVQFWLLYYQNCNTVYFDNAQLIQDSFGNTYTYDENGNLISTVDLQGKKENTFTYDGNNQLIKQTSISGSSIEYEYNPAIATELRKVTADGVSTLFTYDGYGNAVSSQTINSDHADSGATADNPAITSSATYSANGEYTTSLTDSRGNTSSFTYNTDRGYVKSETDPKGNTTSYTYTAGEQISSVTSGGSTVSYGYNSAKQLSAITTPGGSVYGISYDAFGRKSAVTVGGNTLATYTYTSIGQTESVTYGNGTVTRYTYDDLGRLVETIVNDIPQTKTVYDGASRVHEQYDLVGGRKVKFEYDLLDREVKRSLYDTASGTLLSEIRSHYDDSKNRVAGYEVTAGGKTTSYTYAYGENGEAPDAVTSVKVGETNLIENEYDSLNRLSTRTLNTATPVETSYTYLQGVDATKTTTLVASMQTGDETLAYTYDANGNITSVSKNGAVVESYTYDAKNQLASVTRGSDTWTYTYDPNGNVLSVTKNSATTPEKTYGYSDTNWKDKLTSFNGSPITYDAIGNPLQYRDGMSFTWMNGRKLGSVTQNGSTVTFTYDGNGNRLSKQRGVERVDYTVIGGVIYAEKRQAYATNELHFLFDENGTRIGFVHNGNKTYYYRFNLQGDVTGIYDDDGDLIVEYTYDAWGKLEYTTGNSLIGLLNPIRYRGYYYDIETGFYYLQSRYYDPETCRFINADGLISGSAESVHGYNQFAYCFNNPINLNDDAGDWPTWNEVKAEYKKVVKAVKNYLVKKKEQSRKKSGAASAGTMVQGSCGGGAASLSWGTSMDAQGNVALQATIGFSAGSGTGLNAGCAQYISVSNAPTVDATNASAGTVGGSVYAPTPAKISVGGGFEYSSCTAKSNSEIYSSYTFYTGASLSPSAEGHAGTSYTFCILPFNIFDKGIQFCDFLLGEV